MPGADSQDPARMTMHAVADRDFLELARERIQLHDMLEPAIGKPTCLNDNPVLVQREIAADFQQTLRICCERLRGHGFCWLARLCV